MQTKSDINIRPDNGEPKWYTNEPHECILAIDDGGRRGFVALLVLRALMEKIDELESAGTPPWEIFQDNSHNASTKDSGLLPSSPEPASVQDIATKPVTAESSAKATTGQKQIHDYFDTIVGSGTGG